MFRVPDSSTPPSTPDSRRSSRARPSTTPAGPPPTSYTSASFTPAGPPPSSVFGSSQLNSGKPAFNPSGRVNSPGLKGPLHSSNFFAPQQRPPNGAQAGGSGSPSGFGVPDSSPPQGNGRDAGDRHSEGDEDMMEEDEDYTDNEAPASVSPTRSNFRASAAVSQSDSPRGTKRSRQGQSMGQSVQSRPADRKFDIHGIAKGLAAANPSASLHEPDDFILETEQAVSKLGGEEAAMAALPLEDRALSVSRDLRRVWQQYGVAKSSKKEGSLEGIGPAEDDPPPTKANFLSSLLLQLHHPSTSEPRDDLTTSRSGRSSFAEISRRSQSRPRDAPIPKVLLDWLNTYHDPVGSADYDRIKELKEGYSASDQFWEVIFALLLRGKLPQVIELLRGANFSVAYTAVTDGHEEPGYSGRQLQNAEDVVDRAIEVLEACPAVADDDWDIKGADWAVYRRQVLQAIQDLKDFSEGESQDRDADMGRFQAVNFGISAQSKGLNLSTASRRAESKVPWGVYERLLDLYDHLLCNADAVFSSAYDWVEAVIGLAVWWDGEDDDVIPRGSMAMSRRSLSQFQRTRPVDVTPTLSYRRRLASCLDRILTEEESELQINTTNSIEVGLACIFDDDVEAVVSLIQSWSLTIASAVVEVASAGGWLGEATTKSKGILQNFDQSDLMVLSYGQDDHGSSQKDEILSAYAELISRRGLLRSSDGETTMEGWEMAIQILGRLDSPATANAKIGKLLDNLTLDSAARVDKVLALCNGLGLDEQARGAAERYANSLVESSNNYGDALLYYARAHNPKKIREVLDLLISLSLVQSIAYPPASELDYRLKAIITSPKQTLTQLSQIDLEAAQYLSTYLSGYATLRRFYDLRDEEANLQPGQRPTSRPLARKRAAAFALIAVIDSASDSIRGGLYDPDVDVVVQVDGLLTLLGEALPFVDQTKRVLTLPQLFSLLKATESLQTVSSLVYDQCVEVFNATLASFHGKEAPSPRDLLKKSTSNLTASSQFSLVGSSILGSQERSQNGSEESSGVLVPKDVKRGWDWRKGLGKAAKAEDVLRILRLGVAREVARAWAEGEE